MIPAEAVLMLIVFVVGLLVGMSIGDRKRTVVHEIVLRSRKHGSDNEESEGSC